MIELYDYELSADAYAVRLLLNVLGVAYTSRLVEMYPAGEHRTAAFLAISPRGELPVLVDDGVTIDETGPILTHLADRHDPADSWFPRRDAAIGADIARWLEFARGLRQTCGAARLHDSILQQHIDIAACRLAAVDLLRALDEQLWFGEQRQLAWLCAGERPTIADLACFPDVMLAEEGGIALDEFGAIRRWGDRVRAIPGFITMPGIFPL
jgi:glutathione S-transferase